MAKKRSVRVEETESNARAKIKELFLILKHPCSEPGTPFEAGRRVGSLRRIGNVIIDDPRPKYFWRDLAISFAVTAGVSFGLKATRGRDQRRTGGVHSSCSLVADELKAFGLHLSEDAVEKIWRARSFRRKIMPPRVG